MRFNSDTTTGLNRGATMTNDQKKAVDAVPSCVELEDMDGTFEHVVFRVEHVVIIYLEGEDFYTRREASSCARWLKKHAPKSQYAKDLPPA